MRSPSRAATSDDPSTPSGRQLGDGVEPITQELAGALVVVGCSVAVAQLGVDIAARLVDLSAVPALVAFHLSVVVACATGVALALRTVGLGRRPASDDDLGRNQFGYLLTALVALVAFVAGRLATSTIEPSVRWLLPIAAVPPLALAGDAIRRHRPSARPWLPTWGVVVAHVWVGVAGLTELAASSLPLDRSNLRVQSTELRSVGVSIFVIATVAGVLVARHGQRAAAARLVGAGLSGLATALLASDEPAAHLWPIRLVAALAVVTVAWGLLVDLGARSASPIDRTAVRRRLRAGVDRICRPAGRLLDIAARAASPATLVPRRRLDRSDSAAALVIVVVSAGSIALRVAWAIRVGWQPTGTAATVMARAWDVGTVNTPLVGTPTSLGSVGETSHPGPLLFDLLAPFVRLLGLRNGAFIGTALLNLGCWMVGVWAAFRAGGRSVAIGAWVVGGLVIHVAALGVIWDPFNVSVVLLAIYASLLASWAAASGVWRAWGWAVALGSLGTQAYLVHGLLVIGPVVWSGLAIAGVMWTTGDPVVRQRARSALRVGLLVGVAAWVQPAIDVVLNSGGNVRALANEVAASRPAVGISGTWRTVGWVLAIPPQWGRVTATIAGSGSAETFLGPPLPGLLVVLLIGGLWWRSRHHTLVIDRQLRVVAALLILGAVVNVTQLPRTHIRTYTVVWLVVVSLFIGFAVAVSVGFEVSRRRRPSQIQRQDAARLALLTLCSALIVASGLDTPMGIADVKGKAYAVDPAMPSLVDQVDRAIGDGEILVLGMDTQFNQVTADTLLSNLIVRGRRIRVEPGIGNYYGERRMIDPNWSGPMLWVTNGSAPVDPVGRRVARVVLPGWKKKRFDEVAEQVKRWVSGRGPVRLQPGVLPSLPKYLTGWIASDVCAQISQIEEGQSAVGTLPAGALAWLYADGAVQSPALPAHLQDDVEEMVGQAPIEVWQVAPAESAVSASDRLLRDGSECRR